MDVSGSLMMSHTSPTPVVAVEAGVTRVGAALAGHGAGAGDAFSDQSKAEKLVITVTRSVTREESRRA